MNSLISMFFFAFACVAAYEAYHLFRSGNTDSQPNASSPDKDPKTGASRLGGALWGAIAVGSALAAFFFDWLD
jgi:hypothetical protein